MATTHGRRRWRAACCRPILAAGLLAAVVACSSTPTPYQPAAGGGTGYVEQQIETDRWRVSFTGNDATALDTVQNYVLYRAAELTVAQGFDSFTVVSRSTESQGNVASPQIGVGVGGGSGGSGVGIGLSTLLGGSSDRYTVFMDVVMAKGAAPSGADAYDARQVLSNLGPTVVRPPATG